MQPLTRTTQTASKSPSRPLRGLKQCVEVIEFDMKNRKSARLYRALEKEAKRERVDIGEVIVRVIKKVLAKPCALRLAAAKAGGETK